MGITGSVYCTHPNFNYLCGICVNALWMAESSAEITLAINRCLVTVAPDIEKALFYGKRVYVWLSAITIYALYVLVFKNPSLFTGVYYFWSFNPFVGYLEDPEGVFTNHLHTVHNTSLAIVIPAIYIVFFVVLMFQAKSIGSNSDKNFSKKQKMLFLQIFIIGFIHVAGCSIHALSPYITVDANLLYFAQYLWFFAHVIYLTMNQNIRNDCLRGLLRCIHSQFPSLINEAATLSSTVRPLTNSIT
uniref:Serpentine Receptor, class T n=1 Tax=Ditylenchus dipsaci TaxID=166011 RepID=A0A915EFB4_9BILA